MEYNKGYAKGEYPLYYREARELCPNPHYTGGVSQYVCDCHKPVDCAGVQRMEALHIELHHDIRRRHYS